MLFILKDFYSLHAFLDSRLVQRNEVCVSCRDALCKAFVDVLWQDNRLHLEECTHDCHVVYLLVTDLSRNVDRIDLADLDVSTCRRVDDSVRIIDEESSWLYSAFELVE